MEQLLGDEVYHYHSKLSAKEPRQGGELGMAPRLWILVSERLFVSGYGQRLYRHRPRHARKRLPAGLAWVAPAGAGQHGRFGEQTGADPERVRAAQQRLEHVYCEMSPGDGLYFHGNTLHASDPNLSPQPRWGLLCCYNTRHNDPYKDSHHPGYTPLERVPDNAIKVIGAKQSMASQEFLDPASDKTTGTGKA